MAIVFGDRDGSLTDHEQGGNQNLLGLPDAVGDARLITDFARGGDDFLSTVGGQNPHLFGDAIDMTRHAQGGDDILVGSDITIGLGENFLYGDAIRMSDFTQGGNDTLIGGNSSSGAIAQNHLFGDAESLLNKAQGGDDILIGGNGNNGGNTINELFGDALLLGDSAQGGNDTLSGGNAIFSGMVSNFLIGDAGKMADSAKAGDDTLTGGSSFGGGTSVQNTLIGDADMLLSGTINCGNDVLIAGTAQVGGSVSNEMYGDAKNPLQPAKGGADMFVFIDDVDRGLTVGTQNKIYDFSQSQHDKIAFIGVEGVSGFDDPDFRIVPPAPGSGSSDTLIIAGSDEVTLVGFTGTLTAHDFVFA